MTLKSKFLLCYTSCIAHRQITGTENMYYPVNKHARAILGVQVTS